MAKNETITLPKGVAVFPALYRPDTKFDELGAYKANTRVPLAEAEPTIKKLQAIAKSWTGKAMPKAKNPMFEMEVDKETGEETGFVIFKASVKNRTGKEGKLWDRRPLLIDAKKNKLPSDTNPWGGTVYRVKCEIYCSEFGGKRSVSLQPLVVQIIELKSGTGSEPDLDDFDEEDGYEAPTDSRLGADDFDDGDSADAPDADY